LGKTVFKNRVIEGKAPDVFISLNVSGDGEKYGINYGDKYGINYGEKYGINQTQAKIVSLIQTKPGISARAIAVEIGMTVNGVEKSIRELKSIGITSRSDPAKGGHWVVKIG